MVTHKPSETVGSEVVNDNVGVMKRSLFFILIVMVSMLKLIAIIQILMAIIVLIPGLMHYLVSIKNPKLNLVRK